MVRFARFSQWSDLPALTLVPVEITRERNDFSRSDWEKIKKRNMSLASMIEKMNLQKYLSFENDASN